MKEVERSFISLVRLGIGTSNEAPVIGVTDWKALMVLANKQGLSSVVFDGVEKQSAYQRPPKEVLLNWLGHVMKEESLNAVQWESSKQLASLLKQNGIKTYVLKGFIIAECYPKPKHRRSNDMDCFLQSSIENEEVWEAANTLVEKNGFEVIRDFYKHSTFLLPGLMVENHKFLVPFRGNKRLKDLEKLLEDMLYLDNGDDFFEGTDLLRPPIMVSTLFMIEHVYSHFLHEGLNWRHILDWMLFSRRFFKEIDWQQLGAWIDEFGFRAFYNSYYNLGKYLLGEIEESELSGKDKLMLGDIWAPLDLHETVDGVKGKIYLAGNTWRARWKYREFTDMTWLKAFWIQVKGFIFIREPKLA